MTAATNFVQTEVPAPAYKTVADQIIAITRALREDGNDQHTVVAALHVFAEACRASPGSAHGGNACVPKY